MKLWNQGLWIDKTDDAVSLKLEDPEVINLLGKCLYYLILIALRSKESLNEAYEEIVSINDFYLEREQFLLSDEQQKLQGKNRMAKIVSTDIKEPFFVDFE